MLYSFELDRASEPAMHHQLRTGLPPKGSRLFEHPAYVRASAENDLANPMVLEGAASLALLRDRTGLHTVYGYPEPFGDTSESALTQLADSLRGLEEPVRLALSPLGAGCDLTALVRRTNGTEITRPICVVDLSDADPLQSFSPKARSIVKRAERAHVKLALGKLESWFGPEYRSAMARLGAGTVYSLGDSYFKLVASVDHVVVRAIDPHGTATANLFLFGGGVGSYHLSIRRPDPPPPPGVVNLAVLGGLREAQRRGVRSVILGGGRSLALDDALFRFKQEMATRVVQRETLVLGAQR